MVVAGETLGVPIHVYGPETHMTAIVGMALEKRKLPPPLQQKRQTTANFLLPGDVRFNVVTTSSFNLECPTFTCTKTTTLCTILKNIFASNTDRYPFASFSHINSSNFIAIPICKYFASLDDNIILVPELTAYNKKL